MRANVSRCGLLAVAALVMGVAPNLWLHFIDPSVSYSLKQFASGFHSAAPMADSCYSSPHAGDRTMIPTVDYIRILPELVLSIFGILAMVVDPVIPTQSSKKPLGYHCRRRRARRACRHCLPDAVLRQRILSTWCGSMPSASSFILWYLLVALVVILSSLDYLEVQRIKAGEYYALMLFAAVGMMLMSSAIELVLIFIALEISSISSYILAGFRRRAAESAESSLKYFLLGSFATAFFLYGVAMMFRSDWIDERLRYRRHT